MPQLKNSFSRFRFLRFPKNSRWTLPKSSGAPIPTATAVARAESDRLCPPARPAPQTTFQPLIDIDASEDLKGSEEDEPEVVHVRANEESWNHSEDNSSIQGIEADGEDESADHLSVLENPEGEDNSEDNDHTQENEGEGDSEGANVVGAQRVDNEETLETFPFAIVHRTRMEMMVRCLYLALSDDDAEIAALRTIHCERFTHVVRISFDAPSMGNTLSPSRWSSEMWFPSDAPFELRLGCPGFARQGEHHAALTKQQLLLARKYITLSLPYRNDKWADQGLMFPFTPEQCERTRLLIVGPPDRSVDVMAVFVCYLKFLGGVSASELLNSVRRFDFVHPHWRDCSTGNMAQAISTLLSHRNIA